MASEPVSRTSTSVKVALRGPILAIDTATRYAGLALYDGQSVLAEFTWRAEQSHTTTLVPNLIRMLDQADCFNRTRFTVAHLGGLAVALGPGSFTGLRIGLSVAKGLALAQDLPLVGIPTLDIVVCSCELLSFFVPRTPSIRAYLAAGRGRFCVADYRCTEAGFHREGDYRVVGRNEVGADWNSPVNEEELYLFCGEFDAEVVQTLRTRLGDRALVVSPAGRLRRPGYLAQLGWQRLTSGEWDDPAALSPIYLQTVPNRHRTPGQG